MNIARLLRQIIYISPAMTNLFYKRFYTFFPGGHYSRANQPSGGMELLTDGEQVFTAIYHDNLWGSAESRSGAGSSIAQTSKIRKSLPQLISKFQFSSLLDAPCGDINWIGELDLGKRVNYIGADIVTELIQKLKNTYSSDQVSFCVIDVTCDLLPKSDLWMCRDCFIHFPNHLVLSSLKNFLRSDIPYILTTTYDFPSENFEIEIGGFRPIDLTKQPFNLPRPLTFIYDFEWPYPPRKMALWHRDQVAQALPGSCDD